MGASPSGPAAAPDGPLRGRRLVVTRSSAAADGLAERLAKLGADVRVVPLIATGPPADGGRALEAAMADAVAGAVTWVVVSSPAGAHRVVDVLAGRPLAARVCAVGPGTAAVLEEAGLSVDLVPGRHVGEGVVEAFSDAPAAGARLVVARAAVARDIVPAGLAAKGWEVQVVEAYRTERVAVGADTLGEVSGADAVTLTSSSIAEAFADLFATGPETAAPPVVCIGPVTAATARQRGLDCLAVADPHSLDGLVDAIVTALGRPGSPGEAPGDPEEALEEAPGDGPEEGPAETGS